MNFLALLLLSLQPPLAEPVEQRVDAAEVNHFYSECGRLVFTQVIYWRWRPEHEDYVVQAWRMAKGNETPIRDWQRGGYAATWIDGDFLRRVRVASLRESWTQYDPELFDRERLPKESRRELLNPKP